MCVRSARTGLCGGRRVTAVPTATVSRMRYTAFIMGFSRRYFAPGQLQFVTSSTYRRAKLFDSHRFRCEFVETLRQLRKEKGFLLAQQSRQEGIGGFALGMAVVELQVLLS